MIARTPNVRLPGERAVDARTPSCRAAAAARSAFSLIELLVVMSVAVMLTALMMPVMQQLRENAHRVVCMSNMQQIGRAFMMFGGDNNDELPESQALVEPESPQELMLARTSGKDSQWDGLGYLFKLHYCEASECFYCPSHHGEHLFERYAGMWEQAAAPCEPIYTNFHYAGQLEWNKSNRRRVLTDGYKLVLLTDGLRTASDFNHTQGMNSLRGDGSVHWCDDTEGILKVLPRTEAEQVSAQYFDLWDLVQQAK